MALLKKTKHDNHAQSSAKTSPTRCGAEEAEASSLSADHGICVEGRKSSRAGWRIRKVGEEVARERRGGFSQAAEDQELSAKWIS